MSVAQILGYVTSLMNDWGLTQFIQAGVLIMVVIGTFVGVRKLLQGA